MTTTPISPVSGLRGANEIYAQNCAALLGGILAGSNGKLAAPSAPASPVHEPLVDCVEISAPTALAPVDDFNSGHNRVAFLVDRQSGDVTLQIRDAQTGEVLRSVPSEELLATQQKLAQVRDQMFGG